MKIWAALLLLASIANPSSPSEAAYINGQWLFEKCTSTDQSRDDRCMAYVMGVIDMAEWKREVDDLPRCVPPGVKASELLAIVAGYMARNVEKTDMSGMTLVMYAMAERFEECEL